jgi:hypothetical protein
MSASAHKLLMPVLMVVGAALVIMLQFGFIFLLLALLPTVVAYYIDRDDGKPTFKVVMACNIAATLPSLTPMLQSTLNMKHVEVAGIMGNPAVWLYVYGGAAAGWCLIYLCRFIARFIVTLQYEYNIASLERLQRYLVDEWGSKVKAPPKS